MRKDLTVSRSIEINAGPQKVWKALTEPDIIKKYLFDTNTTTNWNVGSEIVFEGEYQGTTYRDKGMVLEFIPAQRISYSYWSSFSGLEDKPENYSLITYELSSIDDRKTMFTWTQQGFANEESHQHSESGMKEFLEKIKDTVENMQ